MKAPKVTSGRRSSPYSIAGHPQKLPSSASTWKVQAVFKYPSNTKDGQDLRADLINGTMGLAVELPRTLPQAAPGASKKLWNIAEGTRLGTNMTCFDDYQHLRVTLTKYFGMDGEYMHKINAAFDKYRQLLGKRGNKRNASTGEKAAESGDRKKREGIDWGSSIFVDYLFFLFEYFVPRAPFENGPDRGKTAQAFGRQLGRDMVIEYLLSICTGVVFCNKKVSSHWQQVRRKLGGAITNHDDRGSPEYLSITHGFEGDFPGDENPMIDELEWMSASYKERHRAVKKTKEEAADTGVPLVLPPILAVILEPFANASLIDWERFEVPFLFSYWPVPEGLHARWLLEQGAARQRAKTNAEDKKRQEQPETQRGLSSATTFGARRSGISSKGDGEKPMPDEDNVTDNLVLDTTSATNNAPSPVEPKPLRVASTEPSEPGSVRSDRVEVEEAANLLLHFQGSSSRPASALGEAGPEPTSFSYARRLTNPK